MSPVKKTFWIIITASILTCITLNLMLLYDIGGWYLVATLCIAVLMSFWGSLRRWRWNIKYTSALLLAAAVWSICIIYKNEAPITGWALAVLTVLSSALTIWQYRRGPASLDNVHAYNPDGEVESRAREQAQAHIDEFITAYNAQAGDMFSVKIAVEDGDDCEHLWLSVDSIVGQHIHGHLDNQPEIIGNYILGSKLATTKDEVEDWLYRDADGQPVGNFYAQAMGVGPNDIA